MVLKTIGWVPRDIDYFMTQNGDHGKKATSNVLMSQDPSISHPGWAIRFRK